MKIYRNSLNLFDGVLIDKIFADAEFNINESVSGNVYKSIKILLTPGTYTISFTQNINIVREIIDNVYTQPVLSNVNTHTITTTTENYYGLSFRSAESSTTYWDNSPIMINSGGSALPYEPYNIVDWYGYKYKLRASGAWSELDDKKAPWEVTSNAKVLRRKRTTKSKT